jgi:uncharacterized protein
MLQAHVQPNRSRMFLILASPIVVVLLGHFAARLSLYLLGDWAWVGSSLVYWGSLVAVIWYMGDREMIRRWFQKSQGSRWWLVLALVMGLMAFPLLFIPNFRVMNSVPLVVAWFLFAVINSTCEEAYWRGFLLDETRHLPGAFGVIYSTVLFTAIHPLMLGVFSQVNAFDPAHPAALIPFWIILLLLSLSYCLIYLNTKSLRLAILSHFLSDLGNLSIFLFMNMITLS